MQTDPFVWTLSYVNVHHRTATDDGLGNQINRMAHSPAALNLLSRFMRNMAVVAGMEAVDSGYCHWGMPNLLTAETNAEP